MRTPKRGKINPVNFFSRPLFGKIYWKKIRLTDGLSKDSSTYKKAEENASNHPSPTLSNFRFTESHPEWVLLYNLARAGQITPTVMKNMRRADLYFLAGHTFPHPALTQPKDEKEASPYFWSIEGTAQERWSQATKLQGNAVRAKNELERRNFIWASALAILAALGGGIVSGVFIS